MSRVLAWEGLLNVRDLGGLETEDGAETSWKAVVRADNIRRLTDAGWEALVEYGVRTVVDLRFDEELAEDPPRELPVDVVHVSVLGRLDPTYGAEINARERAAEHWAVHVRDMYLEFLDRYRENFARAVAEVGAAAPGAVCVHCYAGKDRTGLVSALLLRLAGVSIELVAADYAESERSVDRLIRPWAEKAPDDAERARRLRHARTPHQAMRDVLTELDGRYGGAAEYLLGSGAPPDALDGARARLRGTNGAA